MNSIILHGVEDKISDEDSKYVNVLQVVKNVFDEGYGYYNEPGYENFENWKKESQTDSAVVYSRQVSYGKLFALRAKYCLPIEKVFHEQWHGLDKVAEWNENIEFSSTLKKLTKHIDVVHYANKDVMMVKSRDYVVGRIWRKVDDDYYLIARSVDLPDVPKSGDRVRASINLGAGRYRKHPDNPEHTQIDLIISIEFGGYIPRYIINTVLGKLVIKDYEEQRKHLESLINNNGITKGKNGF